MNELLKLKNTKLTVSKDNEDENDDYMTKEVTKLFQKHMNDNYQKVFDCLQKVFKNSTNNELKT